MALTSIEKQLLYVDFFKVFLKLTRAKIKFYQISDSRTRAETYIKAVTAVTGQTFERESLSQACT